MQILTKYKGGSLGNAPVADALVSPKDAVVVFRDFITNTTATALDFTNTNGTLAASGSYDSGVISLTGATAADYMLNSIAPVTQFKAGRKVFFETYVATTTIAASGSLFVGLSNTAATVPVTTAGAMNGTQKGIGFSITTSVIAAVTGDGATVSSTSISTAATANGFVRLGFVVDGISKVTFFVNGISVGEATTGISDSVLMFETYAVKYATALKPFLVDWTQISYQR